MKKQNSFLTFALLASLFLSCGEEEKETVVETPEITFQKEGEMFLLKSTDTIKKLDIEIANTLYEQETGLMYRESMQDDQGMLFVYANEGPRNFYMKNTYIPLDLIFYNKDSIAINIHENARPLDETSIPSNGPAKFILEVNAGKAEEWGVEEGDKMSFITLD